MVSWVVKVLEATMKRVWSSAHHLLARGVPGIGLERLGHHHGPQIRAADPDIDHVPDGFARKALPGAGADAFGEVPHLVQNRPDLGHHVLAVDRDRGIAQIAQGRVEHGPVFGEIDLLAGEQVFPGLIQPGVLGQGPQQGQGLGGDDVLAIIEVKSAGFQGEFRRAAGVGGEQILHLEGSGGPMMGLQGFPGGAFGQCAHVASSFWVVGEI
jgi:hypothetical protein